MTRPRSHHHAVAIAMVAAVIAMAGLSSSSLNAQMNPCVSMPFLCGGSTGGLKPSGGANGGLTLGGGGVGGIGGQVGGGGAAIGGAGGGTPSGTNSGGGNGNSCSLSCPNTCDANHTKIAQAGKVFCPQCIAQNSTHHACVNQQCAIVQGTGTDTCSSNTNCATHLACNQNQQCATVQGVGSNSCSTNNDCVTHSACNAAHQCTAVSGAGNNTCTTNADCNQMCAIDYIMFPSISDTGKIAYSGAFNNGYWQIYEQDIASGVATLITDGGRASHSTPVIAKKSGDIAFVDGSNWYGDLSYYNASTHATTKIMTGVGSSQLISDDGQFVTFYTLGCWLGWNPVTKKVTVIAGDGGYCMSANHFTEDTALSTTPRFTGPLNGVGDTMSGNGRYVVFLAFTGPVIDSFPATEPYLYDKNTKSVTKIPNIENPGSMVISPDGKTLTYIAVDGPKDPANGQYPRSVFTSDMHGNITRVEIADFTTQEFETLDGVAANGTLIVSRRVSGPGTGHGGYTTVRTVVVKPDGSITDLPINGGVQKGGGGLELVSFTSDGTTAVYTTQSQIGGSGQDSYIYHVGGNATAITGQTSCPHS